MAHDRVGGRLGTARPPAAGLAGAGRGAGRPGVGRDGAALARAAGGGARAVGDVEDAAGMLFLTGGGSGSDFVRMSTWVIILSAARDAS